MCGYDCTRSRKRMLFWETRYYQPQTRNGQGMQIYSVRYARNWNSLVEIPFRNDVYHNRHAFFQFPYHSTKYFYFAILRYLRVAFVIRLYIKPKQYLYTLVLTSDVSFTNSLRSTQLKAELYEMRLHEIIMLSMIPVRRVSRRIDH